MMNRMSRLKEELKLTQTGRAFLEAADEPDTIIIPKGSTNGDMIKAMFPSVEVKEKNNGYEVYFGVGTATQFFNHQWWNAPYKKEVEE